MKALNFSPTLLWLQRSNRGGTGPTADVHRVKTAAMSTGEVGKFQGFFRNPWGWKWGITFFFDGIEKTHFFFWNGNFEDVMVRIFLWTSPRMDGLVSLLRHEHQSREIFSVGWKGRCSFCSENTTLSFIHFFCQQDRFQEFSDWGIIISLNVEDCMLGIFYQLQEEENASGPLWSATLYGPCICFFGVWTWASHSLPSIVVATKHEWFEYCELCVTYSYDGCGCFPNHRSFTSILVLDQCLQDNISFFAISDILGYSSETGW